MKKFLFILSVSFSLVASGQLKGEIDISKIPTPAAHYQEEYTYDRPVDTAEWEKIKKGVHVSFVSTDQLYLRSEVPQLDVSKNFWSGTGWKGERLNAEFLVWSADSISQIHFRIKDLKNASGKSISTDNIQLNKVSYVLSNYPYNAGNASCGGGPVDKAYLMPDRFSPLNAQGEDRFDLPGRTVRPVWVTVNIPRDAEPGMYSGIIEMQAGNETRELQMNVRVQDKLLPEPGDWKFRLDLWQNPWVISTYYQVQPWGDEHKELLKKHLKLYADAGGTFITIYGVHSPWGDNEYILERGMIEWIKQPSGKWKFDYSIFDEYVELCMELGIDEAITIYTPIPWGERFRYLDEKTGNHIYERWLPTSDTFKTNWNIFLTDLMSHLEKKGWMDKTYLGINENAMEQTLTAIKVIHQHSKKWKITYAGDWHKELDPLLDDYSSVYGKEPSVKELDKRRENGRTSTYYICCTPPRPNTFVFSPPIEARWLGWYTWAHHYDGLLRWAYDAWPQDPMRDARFGSWAAGDCYLVYPGGNSSIRFEKMREGIVDHEKIRILKEEASKSKNKAVKKLLKALDEHMEVFNKEKEFNTDKIIADVAKGNMIVEELTEALTKQ